MLMKNTKTKTNFGFKKFANVVVDGKAQTQMEALCFFFFSLFSLLLPQGDKEDLLRHNGERMRE